MSLIEMNRDPTDRQLRQFGWICAMILPLAGWYQGAGPGVLGLLGAGGALLVAAALFAPKLLKPLFVALIVVTAPIGLVVGELAMLLIYFGVFLPVGIIFRIMRRDALQRRFDPARVSYWEQKKQPAGPAAYYRQFQISQRR